jgi:hypothetical protein
VKLMAIWLGALALGQAPLQDRVEFQLHKGLEKQPALSFLGKDAALRANLDPEGMRFVLPADRKSLGVAGIEAKLQLQGDFEITLYYELLTVPAENPFPGAGVQLVARFDSPNIPTAAASRMQRGQAPVFSGNYGVPAPPGAKTKNQFKIIGTVPARDAKGALRLARSKDKLAYLGADGSGAFEEIGTIDIGREEVSSVRAQCTTSSKPGALEIRLIRLEVRADRIPGKASAVPDEAVADKAGGRGVFWAIVVGGVLLAGGVGSYLASRGRARTPAAPRYR